jgi:predicted glycogen debranching enzyme
MNDMTPAVRLTRTATPPPAPSLPAALAAATALGRDAFGSFDASHEREWLVTNGIGGYASGTVGGAATRRYHGLLVAALRPPVERLLLVAKLDAVVVHGGKRYALACNEYGDGTIDPRGYRHLEAFRLQGQHPVWTWVIGDAVLTQRIWMAQGENTTYVEFRVERAIGEIELELQPLCANRDYHGRQHGTADAQVQSIPGGIEVRLGAGAQPCRILLEAAEFRLAPQWHWNFHHREEAARGLDASEDLFRPATISCRLEPGQAATVVLTASALAPAEPATALGRERRRQDALIAQARVPNAALHGDAPPWVTHLVLAADQFIVERRDSGGAALGSTVIAGYPWFSDWGRDTMIALPGLTLATGRYDIAASILRTFARFVSRGMLPNRFPDGGDEPEYNTVDATLWYFVAIDETLRRTLGTPLNATLRAEIYPVLKDIVGWHLRGTRYGIQADPGDQLLRAGEPGVQLSWMDAKVGDWVVTPRSGKCVEINALWFNALKIASNIAAQENDLAAAADYAALAEQVLQSFNRRFWFEAGGHLFDVVDGDDDADDASLRPNQIFAVSLPYPLLDKARSRAVVDVCARELWTPVGLRSLGAADARFVGRYQGGVAHRDGAYHQGTVWSWLLGPFASAHLRVHHDPEAAAAYLTGMAAHLREACVGQVSEIFDGDAPFTPRGCVAQAWGVAETLRVWSEIHEYR